ncbi:uncharacterized protein L203_105899 [Cryptococcus depauperatus CBS 7841]|uniref:Beta-lactamase-related domain-containing protein n=1 Tax=Cryptococcus depauperatus CBS 7841 TaxID=1295531 RepID=A0AAJ8JYF7_9TREE
MRIGGTPGLSLSIMHEGSPVYFASYGYRDVEQRLPLTEETILPVCSMTKAVTSAAIGILVEKKKARWDMLVKDALPSLNINDKFLQNHMTLADLLCHRSGMSKGNGLFMDTDNNILIGEKDAMRYLNNQTRMLPFRGQFAYNNLPYELAGKVIESLSGESFFDFVQRRILDPLGMTRTSFKTPDASLDGVGKCYNALDDGTAAPMTCAKAGDNWFGASSVGMRSCASDLMKLYKALMMCFNDQLATGKMSTDGLPLKQVAQLMSAQIMMDLPSRNEMLYGFGWAKLQLPGRMGHIGANPGLTPDGMSIGSWIGTLFIVILVPDTESAIVVLSNALALNDVADWVGQLVLEEFLEVPEGERNDYISAGKMSAAANLAWCRDLAKELQPQNGISRELEAYAGTYWNNIHIFKIVVTVEEGELYWALQGLDSEKLCLAHYEDDVFTWLQPRNDLSRRGRWMGPNKGLSFCKVEFKMGDGPDRLFWMHDNGVFEEYRKE